MFLYFQFKGNKLPIRKKNVHPSVDLLLSYCAFRAELINSLPGKFTILFIEDNTLEKI